MAKRDREKFSPPALGGGSLLVVFAVLALTVFALLSLSTVRADVRLGDASAESVKAYYAADVKAQEVLALLRNGREPEDVEVASVSGEAERAARQCSYKIPISENRTLRVAVELYPDGRYTVLRWESVYTGSWDYDDSLHVWDGE